MDNNHPIKEHLANSFYQISVEWNETQKFIEFMLAILVRQISLAWNETHYFTSEFMLARNKLSPDNLMEEILPEVLDKMNWNLENIKAMFFVLFEQWGSQELVFRAQCFYIVLFGVY